MFVCERNGLLIQRNNELIGFNSFHILQFEKHETLLYCFLIYCYHIIYYC